MPRSPRGHLSTTNSESQSFLSKLISRITLPRHGPTSSSSTPPTVTDTTNTSAPVQESYLVPSQQAFTSQFQHARNVDIRGGQFTTESGPRMVTHLTINMPQQENRGQHLVPIVQQTSVLHQDERTSDEVAISDSRSMPSGDGEIAALESNLTSQSSLTTKKCHEVYKTLLEPKRPGYALWIPAPNKNLPFAYQREGVQIGDVGIITADGNFSFLFNICVPPDDPINPRVLPEGFAPICPRIDPIDIRKLPVFQEGSYLASASMEGYRDDVTFPGLCFRASGSEGAVLTMPDGAISQDLENLPIFREYAAHNVKKWYRYINGRRGREAKNGDVRLVVGCDKATSWGMAAVSNVAQHGQLKFKPLDAQSSSSSSCGYTWEYSGTVDVKVGPDQKEIDELRREDPNDSPTSDKYLNQCLFVRTLNVTLNDEDWENLNREIGVGYTHNSFVEQQTGMMPFRSPGNRGSPSDGTPTTSTTAGDHGTRRSAGGNSVMESTSLGIELKRLDITVPQTATSCHPSRIINEILLKFPTAKMAITHDENWYSCIREGMTMSSDPAEILASILNANDLREENGVVYLEPKVTREMRYFDDLENLSKELKQKSSNLAEYLYGVDPLRSARWNEIVFLLELCRDTLSPDHTILSHNPPDAQRIRAIETLIGSLLIDELFLDDSDKFGSIYALRAASQGLKPFSSSFRLDTSQKISSILGANSTNFNSSTTPRIYGERELLASSSRFYLLYLALGEPSDLTHTIKIFRGQKLPEWALGSLGIPVTHFTGQSSEDGNAPIGYPHRTAQPMLSGHWTHSGADDSNSSYGSRESDESDESDSSDDSQTAALSPRMKVRSRGDTKGRPKTLPSATRGRREQESYRSSAQRGSSGQDPLSRGTNAKKLAGSGQGDHRGEESDAPSDKSKELQLLRREKKKIVPNAFSAGG